MNYVKIKKIVNRSLKTFDVDIERSLRMASAIPEGKPKIAESGIDDPEQVKMFRKNGYQGFLIGKSKYHGIQVQLLNNTIQRRPQQLSAHFTALS